MQPATCSCPARLQGQGGFSLIELLIALSILSILSVISAPIFMAQRIAANHAAASGSLHAIATAEVAFYNASPKPHSYGTLSQLTSAALGSAVFLSPSLAPKGTDSSTWRPELGGPTPAAVFD